MVRAASAALLGIVLVLQSSNTELPSRVATLRAIVKNTPRLGLHTTDLTPVPPHSGWALGFVSWIASGSDGLIYLLHRGDHADPVVVVDRQLRVVRSWGRGAYTMPHAIRIDPEGNVWTTDAASSRLIKFAPDGRKLMEIAVGGQPKECRDNFCGTTDVAFLPGGGVLVADGYANARIVEYTARGTKVREWGRHGGGPGEFRLPHSIVADRRGNIFVADRENGRIQRFERNGRYLGEWRNYGKTFGLALSGGTLWLATQNLGEPNFSPGWLLQVDTSTGTLLGFIETAGVHGLAVSTDGEVLMGPGPGTIRPLWFRR